MQGYVVKRSSPWATVGTVTLQSSIWANANTSNYGNQQVLWANFKIGIVTVGSTWFNIDEYQLFRVVSQEKTILEVGSQ